MKRLRKLLDKHNISLPIVGFIVLPYSKTHVALPPNFAKVIMGCDISTYIEELNEEEPIISREKFQKVTNYLIENQTTFMPAPLSSRY